MGFGFKDLMIEELKKWIWLFVDLCIGMSYQIIE